MNKKFKHCCLQQQEAMLCQNNTEHHQEIQGVKTNIAIRDSST
ncbi:hypothetical protein [Legionella brunensis]|nr:hypothetical protein [Legionella brunensis]